jgi:hypothetical protein
MISMNLVSAIELALLLLPLGNLRLRKSKWANLVTRDNL